MSTLFSSPLPPLPCIILLELVGVFWMVGLIKLIRLVQLIRQLVAWYTYINLLAPEAFLKKCILGHFQLENMAHISSNLFKKGSGTWKYASLSTNMMFYDIFALACKENKISRFFNFLFSLFLIFLLQLHCWPSSGLGSKFKDFWKSNIGTGDSYHGVLREILIQLFL